MENRSENRPEEDRSLFLLLQSLSVLYHDASMTQVEADALVSLRVSLGFMGICSFYQMGIYSFI